MNILLQSHKVARISPIAALVLSVLIVPSQVRAADTLNAIIDDKAQSFDLNSHVQLGFNPNSSLDQKKIEIKDQTLNVKRVIQVDSVGKIDPSTHLIDTNVTGNVNFSLTGTVLKDEQGKDKEGFGSTTSNIIGENGSALFFNVFNLSKVTGDISNTSFSSKGTLGEHTNNSSGEAIFVRVQNGSTLDLNISNTHFNATTALNAVETLDMSALNYTTPSKATIKITGGSIKGERALMLQGVNTDVTLDGTDINVTKEAVFLSSEAQEATSESAQPKDAALTFKNLTIKAPTAFLHGESPATSKGNEPITPYPSTYGVINLENTVVDSEILANDEIPNPNFDGATDKSALDIRATGERSVLSGRSIGLNKFTLEDKASWDVKGDSTVAHLSTKDADIRFADSNASLNVTEDYAGGATFHFKTDLGDKNYKTNALVFGTEDKKVNVTGTTHVVLDRISGETMKNSDGKKLIIVHGNSHSNAFTFEERVLEKAQELFLKKCKGATDSSDWCYDVQERAEAAAYATNAEAANKLFNLRLHDRLGDVFMQNTENQRVWVRAIRGSGERKMAGSEVRVDGDRSGVQIGGDVFNWKYDNHYAQFGVMGGYGKNKANTLNPLSGSTAASKVAGYSLGVYGTWYQTNADRSGAYLDSWAQYNWFNNRISGEQLVEEYKSKGFTASVEAGYNALLANTTTESGNQFRVYLQPQVQLTYMGVKGNHTEKNGTRIRSLGNHNLLTRVGGKLYVNAALLNGVEIQPFFEFNGLFQTKRFGVSMDGEERFIHNKDAVETKFGVDVKVKDNVKLWAAFANQSGRDGYKEKQGQMGVKFEF